MRHLLQFLLVAILTLASVAHAATVVEIESTQVGGFYDDGTADNDPVFQNYFVGHTSLAGTLFPERRNFFIFDLSAPSLASLPGPILSAVLLLPASPAGYISMDPAEDYRLTGTPFDPMIIGDPMATPMVKSDIFDSLGSDMAPDYAEFTVDEDSFPLLGEPAGEFVIPLSPAAVFDLNMSIGSLFAMGGRMTTHDFDELDEIIFAFSDVISPITGSLVDKPILSLTVEDGTGPPPPPPPPPPAPIPEPSTYLVFGGLALCFGAAGWWRKRRKA